MSQNDSKNTVASKLQEFAAQIQIESYPSLFLVSSNFEISPYLYLFTFFSWTDSVHEKIFTAAASDFWRGAMQCSSCAVKRCSSEFPAAALSEKCLLTTKTWRDLQVWMLMYFWELSCQFFHASTDLVSETGGFPLLCQIVRRYNIYLYNYRCL